MLSITNYDGTLTEALVCRGKPDELLPYVELEIAEREIATLTKE